MNTPVQAWSATPCYYGEEQKVTPHECMCPEAFRSQITIGRSNSRMSRCTNVAIECRCPESWSISPAGLGLQPWAVGGERPTCVRGKRAECRPPMPACWKLRHTRYISHF